MGNASKSARRDGLVSVDDLPRPIDTLDLIDIVAGREEYSFIGDYMDGDKGMAQRHHGGVDVVGAGVRPDTGLRRRVVRLLLLVVVFETLGKKGHGDTLGIGGTTADERERDTNQQDQQQPASNA
jgi:hypothetical protein